MSRGTAEGSRRKRNFLYELPELREAVTRGRVLLPIRSSPRGTECERNAKTQEPKQLRKGTRNKQKGTTRKATRTIEVKLLISRRKMLGQHHAQPAHARYLFVVFFHFVLGFYAFFSGALEPSTRASAPVFLV